MLDENLVEQAKSYWDLNEELSFIRHVANYIYHAPRSKLFIRITEASHRTQEQIESELHWMNFLEGQGIHFAHPIKSRHDHLTEHISADQETFVVAVFREAPGQKLLKEEQLTNDIFYQWGKTLASLHSTTKRYRVPSHICKRSEWNQESYHLSIQKHVTPAMEVMYQEWQRIETLFAGLPQDTDCYGLIHADFHTGNFHVSSDNLITLFDFDDCVYHWFAYDIATIFWSIQHFNLDWPACEQSFFKGYATENELGSYWFNLLPDFYHYRMLLIYGFCQEALLSGKLDHHAHKWMTKTLPAIREHFKLDQKCPFFQSNRR